MLYHINLTAFNTQSPSNLFLYTENRIVDLTNNPYFTEMTPTLERMTSENQAMLRAESIYKKDKNPDTENARNLAYQKVLDNHNAWIAQIETTAGDDLTIIDSTGYTAAVTKVGSIVPQDVPPAPTLRPSSTPGSLRMMVDTYTQNSARIFYNWEISTDGIAFQFLPQGKGGSRRTLSDLELEKKYWFRVSYATVAGSGRPSEAIEIVLTRALTAYGLKKMPKKGKAKLVNGDSPAMKSVSKRAVRAKAA